MALGTHHIDSPAAGLVHHPVGIGDVLVTVSDNNTQPSYNACGYIHRQNHTLNTIFVTTVPGHLGLDFRVYDITTINHQTFRFLTSDRRVLSRLACHCDPSFASIYVLHTTQCIHSPLR